MNKISVKKLPFGIILKILLQTIFILFLFAVFKLNVELSGTAPYGIPQCQQMIM